MANAPNAARKSLLAVMLALFAFIGIECLGQWRSHRLQGVSILNRFSAEPSQYAMHPEVGLRLYRPGAVIDGARQRIQANQHGLRSDEIAFERPAGGLRIALLGASSVMGAYAKDNASTSSALLQRKLQAAMPDRRVEVLNAGMAGFGLRDQAQLLDRLVSRFRPDLVIVYPGFNDFAGYCRGSAEPPRAQPQPLHTMELPRWLVSVDLLLKNTTSLRQAPATGAQYRDAASLDLQPYRQQLETLVEVGKRHRLRLLLATNARAYRPEQSLAEQQHLSQSARYYNPCFHIAGLHALYDRHNAVITEVARASGLGLIPVADRMPGGPRYFVDASHFNAAGEALLADLLVERLRQEGLVP